MQGYPLFCRNCGIHQFSRGDIPEIGGAFVSVQLADGLETRRPRALRAELDCIIVMSACPQDMVPINGPDMEPVELHFQVTA